MDAFQPVVYKYTCMLLYYEIVETAFEIKSSLDFLIRNFRTWPINYYDSWTVLELNAGSTKYMFQNYRTIMNVAYR